MGVRMEGINSYYEYGDSFPFKRFPKQVLYLASKVIEPLISQIQEKGLSHVIVATTCPDSLAPSVGQEINQLFNRYLSNSHVIDIVQGCSGGVTAMLLASQIAEINKSDTMVVLADAAKKANDEDGENYSKFGNGSFSCLIRYTDEKTGLLYHKSRQFKDLVDVVKLSLGHDAETLLSLGEELKNHPRKYLGLRMDNTMAIKLLMNAKQFYDELVTEAGCKPDILILHQVNSRIVKFLAKLYEREDIDIIDVSDISGNCGAASVGIALSHVAYKITGKKVMIGSFGTGGVMTSGIWQC